MDRYCQIYGTQKDGPYGQLAASEGLAPFLTKIHAVNPGVTMNVVRDLLKGFKELEGYRQQPWSNMPLALRYAPMHLYKREDMPKNMDPFCALSISGAENRAGRFSEYTQTILLGREEMHHTVECQVDGIHRSFNYLDQIFGTHMLTAQEVEGLRMGARTVNCDAPPVKVAPVMRPQDHRIILQTVKAIYEDRSVVIRLEKDCCFNARAKELLIQIYSMLQPRLATEIGFAAYHVPDDVFRQIKQTSMRIFILPAGCALDNVGDSKTLILDLTEPSKLPHLEKSELIKWLERWYLLSWERRQQAMEVLFADTATNFFDEELFIHRSTEFFMDPFFVWAQSKEGRGTISTIDQLKELYDSFPICARIPWVKDRFVCRIPELLTKGVKLDKLCAEAVALGLCSQQQEEKLKSQADYSFAREMGCGDILGCCAATKKLAVAQVTAAMTIELDSERKKTAKAIEDGKAATAKAVAEGQATTAQAVTEGQAAVEAERQNTARAIQEGRAAVEAERQNTARFQAAVEAEHQNTVKAIQEGQAAAAKAVAEGRAAVEAERLNTARAIQEGQVATAKAVAEGQAAVEVERQNTARAIEAGQTALNQERANSRRIQTEAKAQLQQLQQQAAEAAVKAAAELEKERGRSEKTIAEGLVQARQAQQQAEAKMHKAQDELSNVKGQLKRANDSVEQLRRDLETAKSKQTRDFPVSPWTNNVDDAALKKTRSEMAILKNKVAEIEAARKKQIVLSAAAGFGVAALICGSIFAVILLSRPKQVQNIVPATVENSTIIPETTARPTTETTQPPTTETPTAIPTEAPLQPEIAGMDKTTWMELVPEIQYITMDISENTPDVSGYQPIARFQVATEQSVLILQAGEAADHPTVLTDGDLFFKGKNWGILSKENVDFGIVCSIFANFPQEEQPMELLWEYHGAQIDLGQLISEEIDDEFWWKKLTAGAIDLSVEPQLRLSYYGEGGLQRDTVINLANSLSERQS